MALAKRSRIKTADEHVKDIKKLGQTLTKEKREFKKAQAILESYEDLRDDVVTLIDRSGLTDEDVHGSCGPHPSTLRGWRTKAVGKPQLGKMQAALRTIGKDIGIVDGRRRGG